jgi:hypothetical protein
MREQLSYKQDWPVVRQRYVDFWNRRGVVLALSDYSGTIPPREPFPDPGPRESIARLYTDADYRARSEHYRLGRTRFVADKLPAAAIEIGPGSLATLLGSEPEVTSETVWYRPRTDADRPDEWPRLELDLAGRWWRITEATARACAALGRGKYLVGFPDLIENVDILASLRGAEVLLEDMVERPSWVEQKVLEINQAYFDAYTRLYEIVRDADGGSSFQCFDAWAPGRVAKVQCDASAMFSPAMFKRFVLPALREQCEWLDYSIYHLDGSQAMCHLDALLTIDALDAIEWTPEPGQPKGGSPAWYGMYKRILAAGKGVQMLDVRASELAPLLDAIGNNGVFIITGSSDPGEIETFLRVIERYR